MRGPFTTIASICARGGSKGLPRKNVLPLAGKPLIAHTIEYALACTSIGEVYVSTDDDEIAHIARQYGATVPYCRPAELASDTAGKLSVIEHLVQHLEAQGRCIETIVDLQPTSPLRLPSDIEAALALADASSAELVVTVTEPSHNPYYALAESRADGTLQVSKATCLLRRQDVPQVWGLNGSIYVWRRAALARAVQDGFWSIAIVPSPMPRERSVDIDNAFDFELAAWLFERQLRDQGTI